MSAQTHGNPEGIRFDYAPESRLETGGFSSFDRILELGALACTRSTPTQETGYNQLYATDRDGLEEAVGMPPLCQDSCRIRSSGLLKS